MALFWRVRLQVVDQRLAEATDLGRLIRGAVVLGDPVGRVDQALEHPEPAIGADGDQAAGAAAIRFGEGGLGGQGPVDLLLPGREVFGLGFVLGAPVLGGDVRQVVLAPGEVVQERAEVRRWFGRGGLDPAVIGGDAKDGVEHRPGPFPVGGQRRGLGVQLGLGQAADQGGIVHEALVMVAEQVPGDGAAGRLIGFDANEASEA